uniref:C2H2-type domain-containing protein n=1 Tax=Parastrongyloides trichosuri TaxID=131310 RepID=A0A0N4Z438_PARTI
MDENMSTRKNLLASIEELKKSIETYKNEAFMYDQERIAHEKEIEKLCKIRDDLTAKINLLCDPMNTIVRSDETVDTIMDVVEEEPLSGRYPPFSDTDESEVADCEDVPPPPEAEILPAETEKNAEDSNGRWVCQVCKKTLASSGSLIRHRKLHTGEKPHRCNKCPMSYSRKDHLDRHYANHHGKIGKKK